MPLHAPTLRPALLLKTMHPVRPSPIALEALVQCGRRHRYERGDAVLVRGSPARALWLLERGAVSTGQHDALAHWRPTRSVRSGEWIDAWSAWAGASFPEAALAETDCVVWEFGLADVEQIGARHPDALRGMLALAAARVRRLVEEKQGLLSQDVLARCARWLVDALPDSSDGSTVVLSQRKRSIAAQIGATPETFSRTLRYLRERHAIDVDGYRIRVRDPEVLRQLAAEGVQRRPQRPGT
jgi:CRP-like cAMP-binding protein